MVFLPLHWAPLGNERVRNRRSKPRKERFGQRLRVEPGELSVLDASAQATSQNPAAVNASQVGPETGRTVIAHMPLDRKLQTRLLSDFTVQCGLGSFPGLEGSAGKFPTLQVAAHSEE